MSLSLTASRARIALAIVAVAALLVVGLPAGQARAASIGVDTTSDTIAADGMCSLREAIIAANTNAAFNGCPAGSNSTTDEIDLPAGNYELTIPGRDEDASATGDLDVTQSLLIKGATGSPSGVSISGGGENNQSDPCAAQISNVNVVDRIIEGISGNGPLRLKLKNLTVQGGIAEVGANTSEARGGGISMTGGHLALDRVLVSRNSALALDGQDAVGGGIALGGGATLNMTRSVITHNIAGAPVGFGGGISDAELTATGAAAAQALPTGAAGLQQRLVAGASSARGAAAPTRPQYSIEDSQLSDNIACGFDFASGGGVSLSGSTSMDLAFVARNFALGSTALGGGADLGGTLLVLFGSAPSDSSSRVTQSNFRHNASGSITEFSQRGDPVLSLGGGIAQNGSGLIDRSTLRKNVSAAGGDANDLLGGGGVFNIGSLKIKRSNFQYDKALRGANSGSDGSGGGLLDFAGATITNSTLAYNRADRGGGVSFGSPSQTISNPLRLIHATLAHNSAKTSGGGLSTNMSSSGSVLLRGTIIGLQDKGSDCDAPSGSIGSLGYNLDSDGTCQLTGTGDLPNTDPQLGAFSKHGGSTKVFGLQPDSPAVDAVLKDCPPPATDQRELARPVDGNHDGKAKCDIGAFERNPFVRTILPGPRATLSVYPKRPARGSTFKLNTSLRRCAGHEGTDMVLVRQFGDKFRIVGEKKLDNRCKATFKKRANFGIAVFKAEWPQQDQDHHIGYSKVHVVRTR
jgi:CSLREA domain-containing protein